MELVVVSPLAYTDYNVLIHLWNVENSIIKTFVWTFCWNMKSVFQVSNWVHNKVFTSFILEMNLWTHDKPDVLMHENNILWEVTTQYIRNAHSM